MKKIYLLPVCVLALLIFGPGSSAGGANEPVAHIVPLRKFGYLNMRFRQLMLDEYVVARHSNVRQLFPQAQKLQRPLLACEGPHELESMSLNMPSVVYDRTAGKYRMWWYNIWRQDGKLFAPLCYAESLDGLEWNKPVLNQLAYREHGKANNCIAGIGASEWVTSVAQGRDGSLRCYFTPHDGTAVLEDGVRAIEKQAINWNPITNMPQGRQVVGSLVNDLVHVMYDPVLERYLASVRTFSPLAGSREPAKWRRAVALYTSIDGVKWNNTGRVLQTDVGYDEFVEELAHRQRRDLAAWSEFHDLPMQRYEGLIVGLTGILCFYDEDILKQNEIAGTETAYFLTWSHDGLNWARPVARRPLLDIPRDDEDWGRHTTGSPFMVVKEKEIWLYHDVGRGHTNRTYKTPRPKQIKLSKLRRDGFAGYQAEKTPGWIQTAPFKADGTLRINADATAGHVRVEVLEVVEDSQFFGKRAWKPLKKFTDENCRPLQGDLFGAAVQWKEAEWSELAGKTVSLRIHLDDATLYSFWTRTTDGHELVVNLAE